MADSIIKPKLQLRAGVIANGDKTPSPATKLLINHGKPNFTIQRSPKAQQNGNSNPLSPDVQNKNNNYYAYKSASVKVNTTNNIGNQKDIIVQSTKFNGVFKPSNVNVDSTNGSSEESFVTLRRTKKVDPVPKEANEEDVPEFILRQRRIQERLAKENVLDFENRRSGYFTHVVMSPTNTEPKTFAETMSSPAVVPSLEMPVPAKENEKKIVQETEKIEETKVEDPQVEKEVAHEQKLEEEQVEEHAQETNVEVNEQPQKVEENIIEPNTNGHVEEEEVAKAIEEVNKAVAGEVDDERSIASEMEISASVESEQSTEIEPVAAVATSALIETEPHEEIKEENEEKEEEHKEQVQVHEEQPKAEEKQVEHDEPKQNGHSEEAVTHEENAASMTNGNNGTIESVSNGFDKGPQLPIPDPSGALGVNYEPKTVVSFSKDLAEPNKYPDTVVKEGSAATTVAVSDELQELAKLKFDIKADEEDVQVTPVLRAE